MKCQRIEKRLLQDLCSATRGEVKAHLNHCRGCERIYRELVSIQELSTDFSAKIQAPEDFFSRILSASDKRGRWQMSRRPVLVALVFTSLWLGHWWLEGEEESLKQSTGTDSFASVQEQGYWRVYDKELGVNLHASRVEIDLDNQSKYVDVILENPSRQRYILRLPLQIEVRQRELNKDFYQTVMSY